jgi:hypothetical protein
VDRQLGIFRNSEYGPKTSVKDRQIRGSLENCCASASDPKIKLRRICYCELIAALKVRTSNKKGRHLSTGETIQLIEEFGVETSDGLIKG